jgi:DHA2 family multidrug resistance protein
VLAQSSQIHQSHLVAQTVPSSPAYQTALRHATEQLVAQGSNLVEAQHQAIGVIGELIARQSTLLAYVDVFRYSAIATALLVPLALLLQSRRAR